MNKAPQSKLLSLVALAGAVALVVVASLIHPAWRGALGAAGIAVMVAVVAVLLSTSGSWARGQGISLAAACAGVVGIGAVALVAVAYIGMIGGDTAAASVSKSTGRDEGAALSLQESNNAIQPPGYAHDLGAHPAFTQFMTMDDAAVLADVPGGTLLPNEVDTLRTQLSESRAFAESHNTVEKAMADGFYNTTNDVPYMGAHFISSKYLMDGVFDPAKPEGLLFSKLGNPDGEWQLVGVWYLIVPGLNPGVTDTLPPEGFAGRLDLWHQHYGLCTRGGIISENNTAEGCSTDHGNFIGDLRWMMHVWVYPEGADNPEGVFTYLNANLFEMQQGLVQAAP
jgi:hypothetical protein